MAVGGDVEFQRTPRGIDFEDWWDIGPHFAVECEGEE